MTPIIKTGFVNFKYERDVCGRFRHWLANLGFVQHKTKMVSIKSEIENEFTRVYNEDRKNYRTFFK